jgi:hypothetical protein
MKKINLEARADADEDATARKAAMKKSAMMIITIANIAVRNIRKNRPRESLDPIVPATSLRMIMTKKTLANEVVVEARSIDAERTTRAKIVTDERRIRRTRKIRSISAAKVLTSRQPEGA